MYGQMQCFCGFCLKTSCSGLLISSVSSSLYPIKEAMANSLAESGSQLILLNSVGYAFVSPSFNVNISSVIMDICVLVPFSSVSKACAEITFALSSI